MGERLKSWNSLPCAGGLLDQPEALMQQIQAALDARDHWKYAWQEQQQRQKELLSLLAHTGEHSPDGRE